MKSKRNLSAHEKRNLKCNNTSKTSLIKMQKAEGSFQMCMYFYSKKNYKFHIQYSTGIYGNNKAVPTPSPHTPVNRGEV